MRATHAIEALFPAVRAAVLATLLLHPDRQWYFRDLARHVGLQPSCLTRELRNLTLAGILRRRKDGNRVYYQADPACPFLLELRGFFLKTAGLVDVLRDLLTPSADRIVCAFVYGSIARAEELSASDIDLMVIGDVTRLDLAKPLRAGEERLARPVSLTLYKPDEFAIKARDNHFVRSVLAKERLFVIGNEHDLEAARTTGKSSSRTDDQGRNRRPPRPRRS